MDDRRLRVCLERTVALDGALLRVRDWPGLAGPLVHVPDPLAPEDGVVAAVADTLAPRYRVLSVDAHDARPYQVDATNLLGMLDQFGFAAPVLLAERLGCVAAVLVAAWHPRHVAGLVLVDPEYAPPSASDSLVARALKDCPPDWAALRGAVACPVLELARSSDMVDELALFLAQLGPGVT